MNAFQALFLVLLVAVGICSILVVTGIWMPFNASTPELELPDSVSHDKHGPTREEVHAEMMRYKTIDNELSMAQPIDAVVLWVDTSDIAWQLLYSEYCTEPMNTSRFQPSEYSEVELQECIKALMHYAPWLNRIYILTMDQVPSFELPSKVTIVSHKDCVHDTSVLPTFNSNSIDTFVHNIPGLSEQFVYLNDDCFLTNYVYPWDFFINNKPVARIHVFDGTMTDFREWATNDTYKQSAYTSNLLTGVERPILTQHNIKAFTIDWMKQCVELYQDQVDRQMELKFRSSDDIIFHLMTVIEGFKQDEIVHSNPKQLHSYFSVAQPVDQLVQHLSTHRPHEFCANDQTSDDYFQKLPILMKQMRDDTMSYDQAVRGVWSRYA